MSLKRKASFPTLVSPDRAQPITIHPMMDDSPRHLNCRTRKRVRDDRPDEQVVYENTLRWLFTAQQRQEQHHESAPAQTPSVDEDEDMQTAPTDGIIDPRQRSLLQFFRPTRTSLLPSHPKQFKQLPEDFPQANEGFPQHHHSPEMVSPLAVIDSSGARHESSSMIDGDTEMSMDLGCDGSDQESKQWLGAFGGCDVLVEA